MWFKNLRLYLLDTKFEYSEAELNKLLDTQRYHKCSGQEMTRTGFVNVLGNKNSQNLCYFSNNDNVFFRIRTEKKVLPASVITEELAERVENMEIDKCRNLTKKEKSELKEAVITALLPRAFSTFKENFIWINTKHNYLVVNAASESAADMAVMLLRKALTTLPAHAPIFKKEITECLTTWLVSQEPPVEIEIGAETEMRGAEGEGGIIRAKKQDLGTDEMLAHLKAGKVVTSLALIVKNDISLVIDDCFGIKRIRLADTLTDTNDASANESLEARMAADFVLMSGTYCGLFDVLFDAFGGLDEEE